MIDLSEKQINLFLMYASQNYNKGDIDIFKYIDKENIQHIKDFLDYCSEIIRTQES